MTTKRTPELKEFDVMKCLLCDDGPEMGPVEFKAHRECVHGLTDHRARRVSEAHIDARDWFEWRYVYYEPQEGGKAIAARAVRTPRRRDDPMRSGA